MKLYRKNSVLKRPVIIILFFLFLVLLFQSKSFAQSMKSSDYFLNLQRTDGSEATSTEKKATSQKTKTPPETENTTRASGWLSFSASSDFIDFGILSPTSPTLRTLDISVSGKDKNLSLLLLPDHLPTSENGNTIPPTTCDNGSCTEELAAPWTSRLTYGIGLRCNNKIGIFCQDSFTEKSAYVGLSNNLSYQPSSIAKGIISDHPLTIQVEIKTNIAGTQEPGTYENSLNYLLLPMP